MLWFCKECIWPQRAGMKSSLMTLKEGLPDSQSDCVVVLGLCSTTLYNSEVWCFFRMKVKGRGITCSLVSFAVICMVATPGVRACPRRCACYMPTEVHCTFRYLTSIPDSIPPNVERINLGCVRPWVSSSQRGISHSGDLSLKHRWLWEMNHNCFNNISFLKWAHENFVCWGQ